MVKRSKFFVAAFLLLLGAASLASASITGWNCDDDGDGVIDMGSVSLTPVGDEYDLTMDCTHALWDAGHVAGDFTTDTPEDPTVRIIEDVLNDTALAWTDYHITIGMSQAFSFVSSGLLVPNGWVASIIGPSAGQIPNNGGPGYVGTINYVNATGDPIAIGDTGTFGFKVSFLGSIAFCTEQVPTPEPATIGLLGLGALALLRKKR